MDTTSLSPRLYRLITHKFKVTRGTSLRSVKTRGTDLTSVCPPHHNHTRDNLSGDPPHIGVVGLVSFNQCWFAARDVVGCQRCCLCGIVRSFYLRLHTSSMNDSGSPPPPEEEPPSAEAEEEISTSPSHQGGRRGGDSRETIGTSNSIRHSSASVRTAWHF